VSNQGPGVEYVGERDRRALAFGKPYKGPESYQVEDGELFHGRDAEADQLIAKILSSRFTLLHAQSGAGKTSLLNARIIPGLEQRGWFPVRVLLQDDPVASIRLSTLKYLLTPPEAEAIAIRRACSLLGLDESSVDIAEVLARYDGLPIRDRRKREMIAPIRSAQIEAAYPCTGTGWITPYACRVLRGSLDLETASEQWNVLWALAESEAGGSAHLSESLPVSELLAALESSEYGAAYRALVAFLDPPGRSSLTQFFANLVKVYGVRFSRFGLVLILDQFEELFTRFVDLGPLSSSSPAGLPDWRLRWDFLEELEDLFGFQAAPAGSGGPPSPLPVRFLISMRSEYIGRLDHVRAFVPALDQSTYHLQLLTVAEATKAMKQPAREYGFGYDEACYTRIIKDLTKEERYVEPTHLQVVCERLWHAKGRELAGTGTASPHVALPLVQLQVYEEQEGVRGIMRAFLWDYLDRLSERSRAEAIEMLDLLITPSGTRNIVERSYLVNAPFRDPGAREQLLAGLISRAIVRAETRLGGQFVEITHEFLIAPIQEAIRTVLLAAPGYARFSVALSALQRIQDLPDGDPTQQSMMDWEFDALNQHRDAMLLPGWAREAMFRSAVFHEAAPEVVQYWGRTLDRDCRPETP
jgi:hypothetical protein